MAVCVTAGADAKRGCAGHCPATTGECEARAWCDAVRCRAAATTNCSQGMRAHVSVATCVAQVSDVSAVRLQTTSGKIARQWGKKAFESGSLRDVAVFELVAPDAVDNGDWGHDAPAYGCAGRCRSRPIAWGLLTVAPLPVSLMVLREQGGCAFVGRRPAAAGTRQSSGHIGRDPCSGRELVRVLLSLVLRPWLRDSQSLFVDRVGLSRCRPALNPYRHTWTASYYSRCTRSCHLSTACT